jgi:hypothetical protein
MIAGWDVALSEMAVGERAVVRIPPNLAYGNTGVPPLIPPQATLELDITVMAATPAAATIIGLDFDGLAYADNTPVCFVTDNDDVMFFALFTCHSPLFYYLCDASENG